MKLMPATNKNHERSEPISLMSENVFYLTGATEEKKKKKKKSLFALGILFLFLVHLVVDRLGFPVIHSIESFRRVLVDL